MMLVGAVLVLFLSFALDSACGIVPPALCWPDCEDDLSTFTSDYVIVGAGSSGSILAGRLAEAGSTVTLLEAGGLTQASLGGCSEVKCPYVHNGSDALSIFDGKSRIPLGWLNILEQPEYADFEWPLTAVSEHGALPKVARAVGGCGIHNAMIYVRGTPADFDDNAWAEYGWNWSQVVEYYIKPENNTDFGPPWHSKSGKVQISRVRQEARGRASLLFEEACVASGIPAIEDFNCASTTRRGVGWVLEQRVLTLTSARPNVLGCKLGRNSQIDARSHRQYQFLVRNGVRDSTAAAYLAGQDPAFLNIVHNATATAVSFDENNKATGVNFTRGGSHLFVRARHEVILAAGALGSPALLLRSGIGGLVELREAGAERVVVVNEHVGEHLLDGVYIIIQFALPEELSAGDEWERCSPFDSHTASPFCQEQGRLYNEGRGGVYSSPGLSTGLFLRSPFASNKNNLSDVQITFHPWDEKERDWSRFPTPPSPKQRIVTFEVANLQTRSEGKVSVREGEENTVVDSPYLKDESDALQLVWALGEVRTIMAKLNATELLPGSSVQTKAEILDYIKCGDKSFRPAGTCDPAGMVVIHLAGTCQLGKVLDSKLRVLGTRGLRVADASVMPSLPSGNTHATTMMIAEKAAAMILEDKS